MYIDTDKHICILAYKHVNKYICIYTDRHTDTGTHTHTHIHTHILYLPVLCQTECPQHQLTFHKATFRVDALTAVDKMLLLAPMSFLLLSLVLEEWYSVRIVGSFINFRQKQISRTNL